MHLQIEWDIMSCDIPSGFTLLKAFAIFANLYSLKGEKVKWNQDN